jgi:response regulator NasT
VAILDFDLAIFTGYEAARVLCEDRVCSTILIVNDSQRSLIKEHWESENFICLVKPINRSALISTVELIVKSNKRVKSLEKEIHELKDSLETRKLIEKAKGILMRRDGLSEQEAFRIMQKQSMDKGVPVKEIAKVIILSIKG